MTATSAASELHEIIGDELMEQVCDRLGGQRVYIPRTWYCSEELADAFNRVIHEATTVGSAYETVAEEFSVSPRTVQRAVAHG